MSKVFSRWSKRTCKQVTVCGEPCHLRQMTFGELRILESLGDEEKTGFAIGCSVVNDSGEKLCKQNDGETNADYANRVLDECSELTVDALKEFSDAIQKLSNPVNVETLEKN